MSDSIAPPQSLPQQFAQQQQQVQTQATQPQEVQQQINKLPIGAQLAAQVLGTDKNGGVSVKVGGSDLLLSSPIALAKGANLVLQVIKGSDTVSLQLVSIDGKLPPTQTQAVSNQLQQNPTAIILKALGFEAAGQTQQVAQNQAAPAPVNLREAVIVGTQTAIYSRGIVLQPTPEALQTIRESLSAVLSPERAGQAIAKLPATINQGAQIDFKITSVQTNPAQPSVATSETPEVNSSSPVLKGQDFQRQQNEQLLSQNFVPKIVTSNDGTVKLNAQVVVVNGAQAVVDTAIGRVAISNQFDANRIAVGSVLSLNIEAFTDVQLLAKPTTIKDLFVEWPALKALHTALLQAGAADQLQKLTGLDSVFVQRLANFFKAVKENNVEKWLGSELMDALDAETQDALKTKLAGDFSNLSRLYNDNTNSGWQTMLFPVFDGKNLQQTRFYVKDLQDKEGQSLGKRFVVELSTGAFGEIQLDGLVRKNEQQRRFDMMVRTSETLPDDVKMGITEIFTNSAEISGIKGSVDFGTLDINALKPANAVLANLMDHSGVEA